MARQAARHVGAVIAPALAAVLAVGQAHAASGPAASVEHPRVVSEQPSAKTPHALDGSVDAFAQVGDTMFAGGTFTQVTSPDTNQTYDRQYLVAFDVSTGEVSGFAPELNGSVMALEPAPDGRSLYISGTFTQVNGTATAPLIKWDLENNRLDKTFTPPLTHHRVSDLAIVRDRLFASGAFPERLLALDPESGADTGYLDLDVAGITGGEGDWWPDVYRFAVNPDQTAMVIIGNFSSIDGVQRRQIAAIDLAETASLSRWYSPRWNGNCRRTPWYTRDVDWAPDGSYFVVVTSGAAAPRTDKLCSTASAWQDPHAGDRGGSGRAEPLWVNHTGGNTLLSVAATGPAVYVAGHPQWLDNPFGEKSPGPGAVARPGIGAIDPTTGTALPWNPTRYRGYGPKVLYPTGDGLWVGSDTEIFAGQYRGRIAHTPLP